jgi:hypothetical protein
MREMTLSARSISARELARQLEISHVSLWRHMHVLRSMLPDYRHRLTPLAPTVQVTGRSTRVWKRHVAIGTVTAVDCRDRAQRGDPAQTRIVGESIRTWINGTFHGVSPKWLPFYLREYWSRWMADNDSIARRLLYFLVDEPWPLALASVNDVVRPRLRGSFLSAAPIKA